MSTRGIFGFLVDGETKVTYNHFDSYPSGLGNMIKNFIIEDKVEEIRKAAKRIKLIPSNYKPTEADKAIYKKYADLSVSEKTLDDVYCLMRKLQGDLQSYINNPDLTLMIDGIDFLNDSLFCEWAYIINLDTEMLEIYRGFQTEPSNSRYETKENTRKSEIEAAKKRMDTYYSVGLIKEIPLSEVEDFDMDLFEENLYITED